MAVSHFVCTFDEAEFHRRLFNITMDKGYFREDALLDYVRNILKNASVETKMILDYMRFDKEWLDDSDKDVSRLDKWYMIALAAILSPIPSLSNRFRHSHSILGIILSSSGWSRHEIRLLIQGQCLQALLDASGRALFAVKFMGIDQYGGWLPAQKIKSLSSRFEETKILLSRKSTYDKVLNDLQTTAGLFSRKPNELFELAIMDASDMLRVGIDSNHSLYVLLD